MTFSDPRFTRGEPYPGLGLKPYMWKLFFLTLGLASVQGMLVVSDADVLMLVCEGPEKIKGCRCAVLTPNVVEFKSICKSISIDDNVGEEVQKAAMVSKALGGLTILQKSARDVIDVYTSREANFGQE